MFKFSEFVAEGGYNVPVVSISKDKVDLAKSETRNEINRNIAAELSSHWINPYGGWMKVRRVLSMYNVFLPNVIFQDEMDGEEVVAINQFGEKWGANLSGQVTDPNTPDESEYYLYYSYGIAESGFYEAFSVIVTEEELNGMLQDEDLDIDDEYGEKDPRQP